MEDGKLVKKDKEETDTTPQAEIKEKENKQTKKKEPKKTLVELVEESVKNKEYTADIIASAFVYKGLLNTYNEDYDNYSKGLSIPKRLTVNEFNKIIIENLNRKI